MNSAGDRLDRLARGQLGQASDRSLPKRARRSHAKVLARVEFVQDPHKCKVRALWQREDRPYRELWTVDQFRSMSKRDDWTMLRANFWAEVESHVERETQKELAKAMLRDTAMLQESFDAFSEYLLPMRDEYGEIKRHEATVMVGDAEVPNPYAGLPVMPLEMRSFDQTVPVIMKLHDKLHGNRMIIDGSMTPAGIGGTDGGGESVEHMPKPSQAVIDEMARSLVLHGQQSMDDFDGTDLPGVDSAGDHEVDDGFDTGDL